MTPSNFVLVHPDPHMIPDDGGYFRELGLPIIVHRDPSASVADLVAPTTGAILFAAQLDSELPHQVCHLLVSSQRTPLPALFFWGPGMNAALLDQLWNSGVRDCFSETSTSDEVALRISKQLQTPQQPKAQPDLEDVANRYNKTVRELAHELKNPLCILHGYAQMAQMGQVITPTEAEDMLSSSREICEMIEKSLSLVGPEYFSSSATPIASAEERAS